MATAADAGLILQLYELRQEESGHAVLRFVPENAGPTEKILARVTTQLTVLLKSSREIEAQPMDVLLPAASGKFRLTYPTPQLLNS